MTEFWVSQARKFCTYCKCWTADNRASIEFHEKGKRHIENVQKKIIELKKKGMEDAIAQSQMDRDMAKMEKAAMEAFKKDLQTNPELAVQYGVKPKVEGPSLPEEEVKEVEEPKKPLIEWHEVKSPDGHTYYWNITTNGTTWDKPDVYKSLDEQKSERKAKKRNGDNSSQTKTPDTTSEATVTQNTSSSSPCNKDQETDSSTKVVQTSKAKFVMRPTKAARPTLQPYQLHPPPESYQPMTPTEKYNHNQPTAINKPTGFSQWTTVEEPIEEPPVDLGLPVPASNQEAALPVFSGETFEKPKFKEKTVSSLGKKNDVAFKKRKFTNAGKNSRRQKFDEND